MTEPTPEPTPTQPDGGAPPSGFTPPASQEEMNRIIGERVQRERAKFSDYSDLKAKAARVDEMEGKLSEAETVAASVPSLVADALRDHLKGLHEIPDDKAELFLTATDPALLLRQVTALVGETKKRGNHVPNEGNPPKQPADDPRREFLRTVMGRT